MFRKHPTFTRKIRRVGSSYVITIPSEIRELHPDAKKAVFEYNDLLGDMVLTLK